MATGVINKPRYGHRGGMPSNAPASWRYLAALVMLGIALLLSWDASMGQTTKRITGAEEQKLLQNPLAIPELLGTQRLRAEDVPNPHWRSDACSACHSGSPSKNDLQLVEKDINKLCNTCHAAVSEHDYIHPVGMEPSLRMMERMRPNIRSAVERGGGKVTCIACHDLPAQCLAERQRERALNPLFFWNAPYRTRTGLCYFCHDPDYYSRLDAHDQVTDNGEVVEERCLLCHAETATLQEARGIAQLEFTVEEDLSSMCTVCHPWIPHPASVSFTGTDPPDHLVAPSPTVAKHMQEVETKNDIKLPLDPTTGKIFCATCHDPHERGAVHEVRRQDSEVKHRLRAKDICIMCHDM